MFLPFGDFKILDAVFHKNEKIILTARLQKLIGNMNETYEFIEFFIGQIDDLVVRIKMK